MISLEDINTIRTILNNSPTHSPEHRALANVLQHLEPAFGFNHHYQGLPPEGGSAALAQFDAMNPLEKVRDIAAAFASVPMDADFSTMDLDDVISIRRMWLAAGTTKPPHEWELPQVAQACAGVIPRWDSAGKPVYRW